ncbi:hypothetical protein CSIM01_10173 [Colletotrichum simmondsii]|uniref:Uncharacterized protein n=1 Tax=Colletotrichum simmondsii TaxID=703756 RepID=A0A135SHL7_9PEZI|nr:hypothetical protein CSIM01_10173 [Colletotrichum simmondsii]
MAASSSTPGKRKSVYEVSEVEDVLTVMQGDFRFIDEFPPYHVPMPDQILREGVLDTLDANRLFKSVARLAEPVKRLHQLRKYACAAGEKDEALLPMDAGYVDDYESKTRLDLHGVIPGDPARSAKTVTASVSLRRAFGEGQENIKKPSARTECDHDICCANRLIFNVIQGSASAFPKRRSAELTKSPAASRRDTTLTVHGLWAIGLRNDPTDVICLAGLAPR